MGRQLDALDEAERALEGAAPSIEETRWRTERPEGGASSGMGVPTRAARSGEGGPPSLYAALRPRPVEPGRLPLPPRSRDAYQASLDDMSVDGQSLWRFSRSGFSVKRARGPQPGEQSGGVERSVSGMSETSILGSMSAKLLSIVPSRMRLRMSL